MGKDFEAYKKGLSKQTHKWKELQAEGTLNKVSLACFRRLDWLVQMEQGREAGQPGGRDGGQRSENVGSPGCADV